MDFWMNVDTALSEVPVNIMALTDDTDFKSREEFVVYNQAGMDLVWNFVTTAGAMTQTPVTPTTAGVYDWGNQGKGMYCLEIPASGGASINNDSEGFGWFTGFATGILPWRGPIIGIRAAALNNALIDGGDNLDVNTVQVSGVAQTGNDNGADLNTLLTRIIGTLATGTHEPQSGDSYSRIGANGVGLTNIDLPNQTMNITGNLSGSVGSVTGNVTTDTASRAASQADVSDIPTNAEFNARTILAANYALDSTVAKEATKFNPASDTVARVALVDTTTANTDMRGTDGANTVVPDVAGTAATPAEVNAEMLDVLTTDTHTEIGQVAPPSTVSFLDMIRYIYKSWRNKKTTDGVTEKLYNDDGATVGQQRAVSEAAGTGTKEEMTIGS